MKLSVRRQMAGFLSFLMVFSMIFVNANISQTEAAADIEGIKYSFINDLSYDEDLTTVTGTSGVTTMSGTTLLRMRAEAIGQKSVFHFDAPIEGPYKINFYPGAHTYGGEAQILINGNEVGTHDFYQYSGMLKEGQTIDLGEVNLNAGQNTIEFVATSDTGRTGYYQQYFIALEIIPPTVVDLQSNKDVLEVGEQLQLIGSITDTETGNSTDFSSASAVSYTSSDESVLTVDNSGLVTAVSFGSATVFADVTVDGHTYTVEKVLSVAADDGVIIDENFDDLTTGSQPSEWDAPQSAIVEFPNSTNKSLSINTTTDESTGNAYYTFPIDLTNKMTVTYDVYAAAPDEGYYYLYPGHFYDEDGDRPVRFYMDSNRDFWASDGSDSATIGKYKGNTWYNIKMVIDVAQQKWDLYIDNELVGLSYDFRDDAAALKKIRFASFRSSQAFIDNFKIITEGDIIPEHHGAEYGEVITGSPIGGGNGYAKAITVADATYIASDLAELQTALQNATSGEIIFIPGDQEIDLTSLQGASLTIPEGVTLASDRGQGGSLGALVYTDYLAGVAADAQYDNNEVEIPGVFVSEGPNVRITGLRLQGQDGERHYDEVRNPATRGDANTYWIPLSIGIQTSYDIEVDNNEIYNFTYAGVRVNDGNVHVHHNNIHHTQLNGLGYGVTMGGGAAENDLSVLIEANIFDIFRHAIAASGTPREQYEARYNIVKDGYSHAFDMHNYAENNAEWLENGGVYIAGYRVDIHHNTFTDTDIGNGAHRIITIRGVPVYGAHINNNWFHIPEEQGTHAVRQYNSYGSHFVGLNAYGTDAEKVVRDGWLPPSVPNFNFSNVKYRDLSGNEVTELIPSSFIQVSADITNMNWRPDTATMIVLLKDEGGAIVNMTTFTNEIAGRTTYGSGVVGGTVSGGLMLPDNVDGHSIEILLWDSLEGMQPAASPIVFQ